MCRVRTFDVATGTSAVARARRATGAQLRAWDLGDLVADAELLVSELVTNAILYSSGRVGLALAVAGGELEVGVTDEGALLPPAADPSDGPWTDEGGRGLRLVDRLALEWGVAGLAVGKQIWFRLAVDREWAHLTACPCGGDDLDRVRLESGRYAIAAPGPWDDAPA